MLSADKASLPEVLGDAALLINPDLLTKSVWEWSGWQWIGHYAVNFKKGSERVKIYTWERSAHILKGIYEELVTLEERHAVV